MDTTDARALVRAALQHDDEAARALVASLYPTVAKLVRAHRPKRMAEEDLAQIVFMKIFQNLSRFSGEVPIEHWVSRIAINTCLNEIAAEKRRPELRHADLTADEQAVVKNLTASTEEIAPDKQAAARQLVEHLLDSLKPVERLVIDLLYLKEKSVSEVQKITGWGASRIKVAAYRARQKLKAKLERLS